MGSPDTVVATDEMKVLCGEGVDATREVKLANMENALRAGLRAGYALGAVDAEAIVDGRLVRRLCGWRGA